MSNEIIAAQDMTELTPDDVRGIQVANHNQVSDLTGTVLDVDKELTQSNNELELLNASIANLRETIDKNERLKKAARYGMQELITRL